MDILYNHIINKFRYKNEEILVLVDKYGKLWFRAMELAKILKYSDTKKAIRVNVSKYDKEFIENIKMKYRPKDIANRTIFLSEYGLYTFVFGSKMPVAIKFKKWLAEEVIPSIRKTGSYVANNKLIKQINKINKQLDEYKTKLEESKSIIQTLEHNQKKTKFDKGGIVYVAVPLNLKAHVEMLHKIGITWDLNKRIYTYNTGLPDNIKIVYSVKVNNPIAIEHCLKALFYEYRYRSNREYYSAPLNMIKKIIKKCKLFTKDNKFKCHLCKSDYNIEKINKHLNIEHNIDINQNGSSVVVSY